MKTLRNLLTIGILSMYGFIGMSNLIVFANDPIFIDPDIKFEMQEEFIPIEPIEPIQFEPVPDDPYITDPDIEDLIQLNVELLDDGRVALNWTKYPRPDFLWYKILHSQDVENPYYPVYPEIEYYEDPNKTGFIHDDVPFGDNFYNVCIITTDDRRGCSYGEYVFKDPEVFMEGEIDRPEREEVFPEEEMHEEEPPQDEEPVRDIKTDIKDKLNGERTTLLKRLGKFISENSAIVLAVLAIVATVSGFTFASRKKQKSISKYMNKIDDTYSEYKMKAKRCEAELYRLSDIIDDELKDGKLEDSAYHLLNQRIENYMIEIQKQIVNEKFGGLPVSLKNEMFKMMEDGEITETEYESFQKLIKRSELSNTEQDSLLQTMKDFQKQDINMKRKKK